MCILSRIYNGLVVWKILIELDLKPTLSWVVFLFNYLGHGPWFPGLEWCWRLMECMHKHHVGFGRCNIMELTSLVILNDNACTSIHNVGVKDLKKNNNWALLWWLYDVFDVMLSECLNTCLYDALFGLFGICVFHNIALMISLFSIYWHLFFVCCHLAMV